MKLEFKSFSDFNKGILYNQLLNSYSCDSEWRNNFNNDWIKYDNYIYNNLGYTNDCGFITLLDGIPIGHISWDPRNKPYYVTLGHNCILKKYRGNGYGKIQLLEAINRIKKNDTYKIIVTTNESLFNARKNYESVGFELVNTKHSDDFFGDYLEYELKIKN